MKIGILTFYNGINYGAVLQAYSLKEYISAELNLPVYIINYKSSEIEKQFGYTSFSSCGSLKKWLGHNATYFLVNRKKGHAFRQFYKHLSLTPSVSSEELLNNSLGCTHIIVGSDQVWNQYSANDDTFFLPGMDDHIVKIGYAISVGNSENILEYGSLRNGCVYKFDALSFREKSGADAFRRKYNIRSIQVLDPTLLLGIDYWKKRLSVETKESYVFLYNLRKSKSLVSMAKELARAKKSKLYACNASFDGELNTLFIAKRKSCVGPIKFMELLMNSMYVVTDSFHGVALSILLHKDFFVELNHSKYNTNERIVDLLSDLGLLDRVVESEVDFSRINPINYDRVEARLADSRAVARAYLMEYLI